MLRTIAVFFLLTSAAFAQYGIARKVITGSGAPPSTDCDASNEIGNVYARTNGAAAYSTFYVCGNTAAATYAWELYSSGGSISSGGAGSLAYYATTGTAISPLTAGSGILTWLTTPSSSNLRSAVTDETGTGSLVFGTSPTLTTPDLGTPSAIVLTNGTGLPASGITGQFATNAQTSTYQVLASDFTSCKTIIVASGTFTITLVASGSQPADGACITILNYGTGVVTLARSGQNINGAAANLTGTAGSATAPTGWRVYSNGTNYFAEVIGGGGGGGGAVSSVTAGASGALTCTPTTGSVVCDADTAYVPNKTGTNLWTGVNDATGATRTAPMKAGTSDPATCTVGDFFFRTDTGATKACTSANTWTTLAGGGTAGPVYTTTAYSATPTFTVSTSTPQGFFITLTGNVTSSTLSTGSATTGQEIWFNVCQDGTGGRTFVWPTNVLGAGTISSTLSVCSRQLFRWDGSNAVAASPMYTSGGDVRATSVSTGPTVPPCAVGTAGANCYGEGTAPTGAANVDILYADSTAHKFYVIEHNGTAKPVIDTISCQAGLGDGYNAISAAAYLQTTCVNNFATTFTITGISCYTDNSGSSTLGATNGAGSQLLNPSTVTCTSSFAAGTQSGTTTIAPGDFIKFTFTADGTSKQTTWVVKGTR